MAPRFSVLTSRRIVDTRRSPQIASAACIIALPVSQDPVDMVAAKPVLLEAEDLESVERFEIVGAGGAQQGAVGPHWGLLSFSTSDCGSRLNGGSTIPQAFGGWQCDVGPIGFRSRRRTAKG